MKLAEVLGPASLAKEDCDQRARAEKDAEGQLALQERALSGFSGGIGGIDFFARRSRNRCRARPKGLAYQQ